ncbi:MAG: hypothetical protein J6X54_02175 [Treponema sp.]|nr:hypothetical protein [Treponema sp.]
MSRFDEENIESTEERKAKIDAQRKKTTTNIFLAFAVVYNVVLTLSLMIAIYVAYLFLMLRVFKVPADSSAGGTINAIMVLAVLVGGMILGFKLYVKSIRWFIKKYHYEDKLTKKVLDMYMKPEESNQ